MTISLKVVMNIATIVAEELICTCPKSNLALQKECDSANQQLNVAVPGAVQLVGQHMANSGTAQPVGQPLAIPGAVQLVGQPMVKSGTARSVGQPLAEPSAVRGRQPLLVPGGMPLMVTRGQSLATSTFKYSTTGMQFVTVPVPLQAPLTEHLLSNEDVPVTRG